MKIHKRLIDNGLALVFLLVFPKMADTRLAPDQITPYSIVFQNLVDGEKLKYEAGWNGIPAARATVTTQRASDQGDLFEIKADARTDNPIAKLWRMRNTVQTTLDGNLFRPVRMYMKQDENRKVSTREIEFAYAENIIKATLKKKSGVTQEEFPMGVVHDPISASFLLRSIAFEVGDAISIDVCDGKGIYRIRSNVDAREDVKIGIGTFPSYRMSLTIEKVLPPPEEIPDNQKKIKSVTLWISADPARIPLRLESSVFIGYVYMELTHENRGLASSRIP